VIADMLRAAEVCHDGMIFTSSFQAFLHQAARTEQASTAETRLDAEMGTKIAQRSMWRVVILSPCVATTLLTAGPK